MKLIYALDQDAAVTDDYETVKAVGRNAGLVVDPVVRVGFTSIAVTYLAGARGVSMGSRRPARGHARQDAVLSEGSWIQDARRPEARR
ncbi:MAG: hypothetical protein FJW90_11650 [Actinobacteria bacterium]|nr:hypothetical protein [Actinomycetota bacterium]